MNLKEFMDSYFDGVSEERKNYIKIILADMLQVSFAMGLNEDRKTFDKDMLVK